MSITIETPVELLREMAQFEFPPSTQEKLNQLMEKNTEGNLTEPEKKELRALVDINERVSIIKAQAKLLLAQNNK